MKATIAVLFLLPVVVLADPYEFPPGVPVDGKAVTWYTPTKHYQHGGTVHHSLYNISAVRSEPFGNANREFPWKTGGMDESTNGASFLFHRINGPITYWREPARPGNVAGVGFTYDPVIRWTYPEGTQFGELLQVDGRTFEVRTMTKKKGQWDFKVYRPFANRMEIKPEWVAAESFTRGRLRNQHPVAIVDFKAMRHYLDVTKAGRDEILGRKFRDVTDAVWEESEDGLKCYCPTASKPGGITPVKYQGDFFHGQSCVKCHDTVGKSVSDFEPIRDWYGQIRGADGVFSFSIFDDSCAARNGFRVPVVLRKDLKLVQKGR